MKIALLLFSLSACAASNAPSAAPAAAPPHTNMTTLQWVDTDAPFCGFHVKTPGKAVASTNIVDTAAGKIEMYLWTVDLGATAYLISCASYFFDASAKVDPEKLLDGGRDGVLRSGPATLRHERKLDDNGHAAREFVADGRDIEFRVRAFFRQPRMVSLTCAGPRGSSESPTCETFLTSAQISDPPAGATPAAAPAKTETPAVHPPPPARDTPKPTGSGLHSN